MTTSHTISHAEDLYHGAVRYERHHDGKRGVRLATELFYVDLGAPAAADPDAFIKAATSTELPNDETVTYTFPAANTSPTDAALRTGILPHPTNVTAAATHGSSVVAMTITVTGTDEYGATMVEDLAIAATGTSQSAAGKKAFKTITSIAITAEEDAEANTLNMGFGKVYGLPYAIASKNQILSVAEDGKVETTSTVVVADSTDPATATTGDVRGTVAVAGTPDGTKAYGILMARARTTDKATMFGVDQYGG